MHEYEKDEDGEEFRYVYTVYFTFRSGRVIERTVSKDDLDMIFDIGKDFVFASNDYTRYIFEHEDSGPMIICESEIESVTSKRSRRYKKYDDMILG